MTFTSLTANSTCIVNDKFTWLDDGEKSKVEDLGWKRMVIEPQSNMTFTSLTGCDYLNGEIKISFPKLDIFEISFSV